MSFVVLSHQSCSYTYNQWEEDWQVEEIHLVTGNINMENKYEAIFIWQTHTLFPASWN